MLSVSISPCALAYAGKVSGKLDMSIQDKLIYGLDGTNGFTADDVGILYEQYIDGNFISWSKQGVSKYLQIHEQNDRSKMWGNAVQILSEDEVDDDSQSGGIGEMFLGCMDTAFQDSEDSIAFQQNCQQLLDMVDFLMVEEDINILTFLKACLEDSGAVLYPVMEKLLSRVSGLADIIGSIIAYPDGLHKFEAMYHLQRV